MAFNPAGVDSVANGTITAADVAIAAPAGDGVLRTGASTAGSTVVAAISSPGGDSNVAYQITGTWVGTLFFESSFDGGTNWIATNARQTGILNTVLSESVTTNGLYRSNAAGATHIRVRCTTLTSGTATVLIRVSYGIGAVFLNAGIPPGSDNIGKVSVTDSAGQTQYNFPAGYVRTTDEPRQILFDPFDSTVFDANIWAVTSGNSAPAPSLSSGNLILGTGTAANGYGTVATVPAFKPVAPSWIGFSPLISLPDGAAPIANSYRFWGSATFPATPTAANPVTNGYGFEMTTAGKLMAVVYSGGVRTQVADLSSSGTNTQPLDANLHRYLIYVRPDRTYFYIDSLATPVASTSGLSTQIPNVQTLPATFLAIAGATAPASNAQIVCSGTSVWDTGKNATQVADGNYPWRKAGVSGGGQVSTMLAPAAGVWTPYSGTTATTINLAATEALVNLHAFAPSADAIITIGGAAYTVRSGTGFDYAPAKPPTGISIIVASGLDYFIETAK